MKVALLAAGLFCALPLMAGGPRAARKAQNQALGSMTTVGPVFINGVPAPADLTIFPGDTLKTGDMGSAAFSISGKGAFKKIVWPDSIRVIAEVHAELGPRRPRRGFWSSPAKVRATERLIGAAIDWPKNWA